ncbi:MAG: hypothetical protein AB1481_04010 [Candidatus Omnitrophota bacterium]
MSRRAAVPVTALIILIIISLALAATGFLLFQKEKEITFDLQSQLKELNEKQKVTEKNLEESSRAATELRSKVQELRQQIDVLSEDLQKEKIAKQESLTKLELLKVDLEEQRVSRQDLEKKLSQAEDGVRKAQSQLKELDNQKKTLEAKLKEIEAQNQGVELGQIVVTPETAPAVVQKETQSAAPITSKAAKYSTPPAALGLEGKVLVVNKDYNFVVINLGTKDGVAIADTFALYHSNRYLGDVKVEKIHDSMAAAGFVTEGVKELASEGDRVVQKK